MRAERVTQQRRRCGGGRLLWRPQRFVLLIRSCFPAGGRRYAQPGHIGGAVLHLHIPSFSSSSSSSLFHPSPSLILPSPCSSFPLTSSSPLSLLSFFTPPPFFLPCSFSFLSLTSSPPSPLPCSSFVSLLFSQWRLWCLTVTLPSSSSPYSSSSFPLTSYSLVSPAPPAVSPCNSTGVSP